MPEDIGKVLRAIIHAHSRYIPKRNRNHWYVDGTNGIDQLINQQGRIPDRPFATIAYALTQSVAGDCIHIAEGVYDEATSIPAALAGLEVQCEPGVILNNTTPGTVVDIAAPYVDWFGGLINQAGQIGFNITGEYFYGEDIVVDGCSVCYDVNEAHPVFIRCRGVDYTTTGFDVSEPDAYLEKCVAYGTPATRGFYWSHTNAHSGCLFQCHSLNNSGAAYEFVAGADENSIVNCSQSVLCGGPVDAGANNSWINHLQESQITPGQTLAQDLASIHTDTDALVTRGLFYIDYWSDPSEEEQLGAVAGTIALPDVTVADLPGGTVVRVIAMFKFRMIENTNAAANKLNGGTVAGTSQVIQVRDDTPGTWRDAINFVDDQLGIAASTRESGDVLIGSIDIAVEVDGNDTYNFQWLLGRADQNNLNFNDCQTGLRVWYSV